MVLKHAYKIQKRIEISSGLPYLIQKISNLGFPDIAAFTLQVTFPCKGSYCAAYAVHAEVSCSIQLSYGAKSNLNRTPFRVCPANVLYFYFSRNLAIKKSKKSHLILWIKKCILEKLRNEGDVYALHTSQLLNTPFVPN
jgi:hypothetical protein